MGGFEMIDRILQALQHSLICVDLCLSTGAFEQLADISVEVTEHIISLFIDGFSVLKFLMQLFEKFTKSWVSHGKASPFQVKTGGYIHFTTFCTGRVRVVDFPTYPLTSKNPILYKIFIAYKRSIEMSAEQILVWIVIGGIAGILAEAFIGGLRSGLIGAIVVGILGAIIGGWLFGVLGLRIGTGLLAEIIKAFIGAAVLLLILRSARRL
jgi:uncharacterized membrane protein YeaQ/YmgE (transglycosylase-associated protein family)